MEYQPFDECIFKHCTGCPLLNKIQCPKKVVQERVEQMRQVENRLLVPRERIYLN